MERKKDLGKVEIFPDADIIVGSYPTLTITYTVGSCGLPVNGSIKVNLPHDCWEPFPKPGGYYQKKNIVAKLETKTNAKITLMLECSGECWAVIFVDNEPLLPGNRIHFIYGFKEHGNPGIRAQTFPEDFNRPHGVEFSIPFRVLVDINGNRQYQELEDYPRLRIIADKPSRLNVVIPSILSLNKRFPIKISILDRFKNIPGDYFKGELHLREKNNRIELPHSVTIQESNNNHCSVIAGPFTREGIYRIKCVSENFKTESNPVKVEKNPKFNLYWGDIHGHTLHSDGVKTPQEYYEYARYFSHLDFAAVCDHMEFAYTTNPSNWEEMIRAVKENYVENEFVTLKSFEWTSNTYGHRCIYFPDDKMEPFFWENVSSYFLQIKLTPDEFYKKLEGRNIISVPHHTLYNFDWKSYYPVERLVEIYSCWGSSEYRGNPLWDKREKGGSVQEGLAKGYRLGIISSSDTHDSSPGRCFPGNRAANLNFKGGLVAVYAPSLTREEIYQALYKRRCYATTGERIILLFTINNAFMGEEIEIEDSDVPRIIYGNVIGTEEIESIEVIRNGKVVYRVQGERRETLELNWKDKENLNQISISPLEKGEPFTYYYLRIKQVDGNMAWSSPIWVTVKRKEK